MNWWIIVVVLSIAVIGSHELGHYIFAKLFGWNPKFGLSTGKLSIGIHVAVDESFKVKDGKELSQLCQRLIYFKAGGLLCIPVLAIAQLFIVQDLGYAMAFMSLYSLLEVLLFDFGFLTQIPDTVFYENHAKEESNGI